MLILGTCIRDGMVGFNREAHSGMLNNHIRLYKEAFRLHYTTITELMNLKLERDSDSAIYV